MCQCVTFVRAGRPIAKGRGTNTNSAHSVCLVAAVQNKLLVTLKHSHYLLQHTRYQIYDVFSQCETCARYIDIKLTTNIYLPIVSLPLNACTSSTSKLGIYINIPIGATSGLGMQRSDKGGTKFKPWIECVTNVICDM